MNIFSIVTLTMVIIVTSIIFSPDFALTLAKNSHKTLLKDKLIENNLLYCSIENIEYDKQDTYSYGEEGEFTAYYIKNITLRYDEIFFYNYPEKEIEKLLTKLYKDLDINITYSLAKNNFRLKNDEKSCEIVLTDKNGNEYSYDGHKFDKRRI